MKLIAGLGNPGAKYENSRHNAGWGALDLLAEETGIPVKTLKFKGMIGSGFIDGEKVLLVKPLTYMNLSGECLREVAAFYRIAPEDIIVIYDDIDLEPGQLRIRAKGSAGGHNGMKSVIACLGTQEFPRIRIGVGAKPERMDLADYVLGHPQGEDQLRFREGQKAAAKAAREILSLGLEKAMNRANAAANQAKKSKKQEGAKQESAASQPKQDAGSHESAAGSPQGAAAAAETEQQA